MINLNIRKFGMFIFWNDKRKCLFYGVFLCILFFILFLFMSYCLSEISIGYFFMEEICDNVFDDDDDGFVDINDFDC